MALRIKKVYIDSRFKTKDSISNSDFKFQLTETVDLPLNCVCCVDDIIIPHSWHTVEYFNNKIYVIQVLSSPLTATYVILTLTKQNHTGTTLAAAIKSQLDVALGSDNYTVVFNVHRNTITNTSLVANTTFKILTDDELSTHFEGDWQGPAYSNSKPQTANDIFRISDTILPATAYETVF